jgi:hypothetical protein
LASLQRFRVYIDSNDIAIEQFCLDKRSAAAAELVEYGITFLRVA